MGRGERNAAAHVRDQPLLFAFPSNGDLAVSVDYRVAVRMWDVATGEMIRTFEGKPDGLELSLSLQNGRAVLGTTTAS